MQRPETPAFRLVNAADSTEVSPLGKGAARSGFAFQPGNRPNRRYCTGQEVQIINIDSGQVTCELPIGQGFGSTRIAWHPSGEYLAVWSEQAIGIWNVPPAGIPQFADRGVPARLLFNENGSLLASQTFWDSRLLVWDPTRTARGF